MQYSARVEIHNASSETYERLHAAMEAQGFNRFVTDNVTRKRYHAPTGMYSTDSSAGIRTVMLTVLRAALPIDPGAEIVVSGPEGCHLFNCREQEPSIGELLTAMLQETNPATLSLGSLPTGGAAPPTPDFFSSVFADLYSGKK